jgi:uncharacterized protein YhaN
MRFTDLSIAGFGVWSGLELVQLSPGLTVICGPNEAGKTTIAECLRGVLYGFTPSRRQKYLPPVHGGVGGGQLCITAGDGRYELSRLDDGARLLGGVTVTGPDGTTQGEPQLKELLAGIDETLFTNVFAVGLRELQELATLNDTQAAEWLYDLSTGLDGISLADVLGELRTARSRLLAGDGGKSQVIDLLTQRDALQREIAELGELTPRYWRLSDERDALDAAVRDAESAAEEVGAECRKIAAAITVRELWQLRTQLDLKRSSFGDLGEFPANALRRFERIAVALRQARRRRARIGGRRRRLREKRRAIRINERLWRQAPRVAALAEHESWLASLDGQLAEARKQFADHERTRSAAREPFGVAGFDSRSLDKQAVAALRAPAALVSDARKQLNLARDEYRASHDKIKGHGPGEVERALARRGETNLAEALEKQGQLVADYRRRLQLDDRLDQMALHRDELEEKQRGLIDRQVMPLWLLVTIATVFVIGGGLVLAGVIIPWGVATTLLGALIAGGAAVGKVGIERAAAQRLDATGKHLQMLARQFDQANEERRELDEQLPSGGGALASRLQAAEAELASLEELLSADARERTIHDEAAAAKERLKSASERWDQARRQWQKALSDTGLPSHLSTAQVKRLVAGRGEMAQLEQNYDQARVQLERLQREERTLAGRLEQIWIDAGLAAPADAQSALVERLRSLRHELAAQEEQVRQRSKYDNKLDRLRRLSGKYQRRVRRLARLRRRLVASSGAIDEADFRRHAAQRAELDNVSQQHSAVAGQIQAALSGACNEQDIAELVALSADELEQQRVELTARQQAASDEIKRLAEERGRLGHEQKSLAEDRRLGQKQLELSVVEQRMADAMARWRTVAATERLLTEVKQEYERNRQPEVLEEASRYLEQMSDGRYRRVWTTLDEHTLRVDEQDRSLPIELLSTGAREQLFLCLRLALASRYARHGKPMPMVLDDVLVNFDPARAMAAAGVIAGFARAGHQLLLFTCHEHIAQLFVSLREDVRKLPANSDASRKIVGPAVRDADAVIEPPKRRNQRRAKEAMLPEPAPAVDDSTPVLLATDEAEVRSNVPDEVALPTVVETVQVVAAPPIAALPLDGSVMAAESPPQPPPPAGGAHPKPARRRRADGPHRVAPYKARRRQRWSAEEFDGELEDRVNAALAKAAWTSAQEDADDAHSSSDAET